MNDVQLNQIHTFLATNGVNDHALTDFLAVSQMFNQMPLHGAKTVAHGILDKCEWERNIPARKAQVDSAQTSERVEEIVRQTLTNGIPHMIKKVTA